MALARFIRTFPRSVLGVWVLGAVLPAVMISVRGPAAGSHKQLLQQTYGHELAAYLGYCPAGVLVYVLAALTVGPVLVLLLCVEARLAVSTTKLRALRVAGEATLRWVFLVGLGSIVLLTAAALRPHDWPVFAGWTWRVSGPLVISALPSVGIMTLLSFAFQSRLWGLLVGFCVAVLVGFLGVVAYVTGVTWLPGGIDRALFSGVPNARLLAAVEAGVWLVTGVLLGHLLANRPRRVHENAIADDIRGAR